jgi:hypothetical protein
LPGSQTKREGKLSLTEITIAPSAILVSGSDIEQRDQENKKIHADDEGDNNVPEDDLLTKPLL